MLKLGYKASAEQFGPTELLDFSCLAEEVGFDFDLRQRPFPAVEAHRRARAGGARLARRARRPHPAGGDRHQRPDADLPLPPVGRGAGLRHLGRRCFRAASCSASAPASRLNEVPSSGIPWPGAKERRDRLREAIRLINTLWTEDRVSFEGQFYRTESATIYDKPKQKVPIWVAASGPLAAAMAGQIAEGFICTSGKNPQLYTDSPARSSRAWRGPGAARTQLEKMIEVKVSFDSDAQEAKELTRHWAALALSPEEKVGVEDPVEMERLADALPLDRAASRWIVSSDPDEQVERIRPYVEFGFRHLVFHAPGPDQARFLKLYAEQVLPRLRKPSGDASRRAAPHPGPLPAAGRGRAAARPGYCRQVRGCFRGLSPF